MFSKVFKMKASTLCAGSALLVLGGFMSVNLAGCGGGGGGGGLGSPTATPSAQSITFTLQRQDGSPSVGGTVSLTGPATLTGTANSSGAVTIPTVPPGTYTVIFTVVDDAGATVSTTTSLTITRASNQNFLLLQGQSSNSGAFSVTGTVRLNPVVDDPDNDTSTANCTTTSTPVTGAFLVTAIDLNTSLGQPIIAQVVRAMQSSGTATAQRGKYTIRLPYRPQAFRIVIGRVDDSGAVFSGRSATTNFAGQNSVSAVDICVNQDGTIPGPVVTSSPIPTGTGVIPTTSATFTPVATITPEPTATTAPTPTNTPTGTGTGNPTSTPVTNPTLPGL
ncbi:hypothetical protein EON80_16280 [bacterium]|nr:MAG: hypothetical protein EON80_16280 [bacterium]